MGTPVYLSLFTEGTKFRAARGEKTPNQTKKTQAKQTVHMRR